MLTLAITGFQADPQLVTDTIGLEPTFVGRTGEVSLSGRLRTFNGWWHEVEGQRLVDGAQHDTALNRILALLSGREGHFAKLRALVKPNEVTIYGGLYVPTDAQCGIWLDPDQMQTLAACGVGWGWNSSLATSVGFLTLQTRKRTVRLLPIADNSEEAVGKAAAGVGRVRLRRPAGRSWTTPARSRNSRSANSVF